MADIVTHSILTTFFTCYFVVVEVNGSGIKSASLFNFCVASTFTSNSKGRK